MLLTRSPLSAPEGAFPLDLHVLSTPPAFVLSQDQTLRENLSLTVPLRDGLLTVQECLAPEGEPSDASMCVPREPKAREASRTRCAVEFSKTAPLGPHHEKGPRLTSQGPRSKSNCLRAFERRALRRRRLALSRCSREGSQGMIAAPEGLSRSLTRPAKPVQIDAFPPEARHRAVDLGRPPGQASPHPPV